MFYNLYFLYVVLRFFYSNGLWVTALDAASIITSYTFTIYSTTTSSYIQYKSGNIG